MYIALLFLLLAGTLWMAGSGYVHGRRGRLITGVVLLIATILFFSTLEYWGEMLWFRELGYGQRFWILLGTQGGAAALAGLAAAGGVALLTRTLSRSQRPLRSVALGLALLLGGYWGWNVWDEFLLWWNGEATGTRDPILGRDIAFYLFALPWWDQVFWLALAVALISLALTLVAPWVVFIQTAQGQRDWWESPAVPEGDWGRPVTVPAAFLLMVLAGGKLLDLFHLLYSRWSALFGPGWTDVHVRLPAYWTVVGLMVLLVPFLLWPRWGRRLQRRFAAARSTGSPAMVRILTVAGAVVVLWIVALGVVPGLFQWLVVQPNEITLERPYIRHNIAWTRLGFGLHNVDERQFPAAEQFTREMAEANADLLGEVRLWDWRALDQVYQQFQEIRLYYEFPNIDIDRYHIDGHYRQVMVAAREMAQENLPQQSQTFVNRRFKYTHGYGVTMAPVSEFTPGGLPRLLIRDLPPQSVAPSLEVKRPEVYFGELTTEHVVVNSEESEFDYPLGKTNVYVHYAGEGGVPIRNLWRKFLYGWIFDGTRFLLSGYTRPQSRVMFHREIRDRVRRLAPFLHFDADPYIVLSEGRLYWIVDAYTTSTYFPYSEPFSSWEEMYYRDGRRYRQWTTTDLHGMNYIRNAVKAVVDAYSGRVDFYVFDPDDPIIQAWGRALPGLLKPRSAMPPDLQLHIRYPEGFLLAQGLVYAKYHMTDPVVFYNQEDLWVRATERYYQNVQPVEPYYVMWQAPGSDQMEFILMLPFTPKNRQVLIGWIAGRCDGERYGEFLAYQFPKDKRVLGPQQVETKIDQDPYLSSQLSLWDQRGSRVIRGNVLAIPIADTLLYVEPIYLQAETAAYPELRLVVLMHGDNMSFAPTFEEALEGLFAGPDATRALPTLIPDAAGAEAPALGRQARTAFEDYLRFQGQRRFDEAARALQTLDQLLQNLAGTTNGPAPPGASPTNSPDLEP